MMEPVIKAFLLGLSTGALCLGYCSPVFVPLMLAEQREGFYGKLIPFLQFMLGRLIAYLTFGLVVGWAGSQMVEQVPSFFIGLSFIGLAIFMFLYGLKGGFPNLQLCRVISPLLRRIKIPFVFGLFMGFNLCPPFLLAFTDVFVSGEIFYGLAFFLVFFLVTSVFLFPLIFLGYLSALPSLRQVAQLAALIISVIYLFLGVTQLLS